MQVKIWTARQLLLIQKLVSEYTIPEIVSNEALNVVSILDKYYGTDRKVDIDNGGFLLLITDCTEADGEIKSVLDKYHIRADDAELDDILCTSDGITWKSTLYLVSNDYGITFIYPCIDKAK